MKRRIISIAFLVFALILTLVLAFTLVVKPNQQGKTQNSIALSAPPFVGEAQAQDSPEAFNIGAYLDQEAGISAYFKASSINLNSVRSLFRTIELETEDYIIGSIPIANYVEYYDVHVYVNKDGWILAYYLKQDPAAKIVHIKAGTITTTHLKNVVSLVAATAGSPFTDVTYYDFRFPTANRMLLVYEDPDNGNDFTILLPTSFVISERSFSLYEQYSYRRFYINGVEIPKIYDGGYGGTAFGLITASQLMQNVTYTISLYTGNLGALVIVYMEPVP
jgi:hypothetical protein